MFDSGKFLYLLLVLVLAIVIIFWFLRNPYHPVITFLILIAIFFLILWILMVITFFPWIEQTGPKLNCETGLYLWGGLTIFFSVMLLLPGLYYLRGVYELNHIL